MHPHSDDAADVALLDLLTAPAAPSPSPKTKFSRRDAALDPLMIAAAAASGPHITRNHYHHDFFPGVMLPQHEGSWDWTKWSPDDPKQQPRRHLTYVSRQAPRRQRLGIQDGTIPEAAKENDSARDKTGTSKKRRPSIVASAPDTDAKSRVKPAEPPKPVEVKCMARTRIPTPHGPAFLHLYHNTRDNKEHLAIVVDPAQYADSAAVSAPPIRSRSLDAVWDENETEMDRITRGAYVGRLSPTSRRASSPPPTYTASAITDGIPSPLIRIHSECFTGETVGSMRCDCGEQLDEAIRLISQPITLPAQSPLAPPATIPGRGAVVYLRQEGRGIGLLSKIRAYNLQDLGHDTVTANLMLGHQADERGYEIAGAILRDLGLGGSLADSSLGEGVRLLTNNPDKVEALQREGVTIVERVPMVPRSWQHRNPNLLLPNGAEAWQDKDGVDRIAGATLIGGNSVHGEDLDKYLRTKVLRMGHMLPLWMEDPEQ